MRRREGRVASLFSSHGPYMPQEMSIATLESGSSFLQDSLAKDPGSFFFFLSSS